MFSMTIEKNKSMSVSMFKEIAIVFLGTVFLFFCTHFKVYLPISPVPISMQNFGVFILAAILGPNRVVATLALYYAEGFVGLPVFTSGGGWLNFAGVTGGYLMSYLLVSYQLGICLSNKKSWHYIKSLLTLIFGFLMVLIGGTAWLAVFVGWNKAIIIGFLPFLVGDVIKAFAVVSLLPVCRKVFDKFVGEV